MDNKKKLLSEKSAFLVGTSGTITSSNLILTKKRLLELGINKIHYSKNIFSKYLCYAGDFQRRFQELNLAYKSTDSLIFNIIGGMGAIQILPYLDYKSIKKTNKILIGLSDLTILLNAIYQKTGKRCIHGPHFGKDIGPSELSCKYLIQAINKENYDISFNKKSILKEGLADSRIVGGNLELLVRSLGTPYEIETRNKILFLEDYDMKSWRVFDILWQLKVAGKFDKINGIILGYFKECGEDIDIYLKEFFKNFNCPIIMNQQIGHNEPNISIPIGERCIINTNELKWGIKF